MGNAKGPSRDSSQVFLCSVHRTRKVDASNGISFLGRTDTDRLAGALPALHVDGYAGHAAR